MTPFINAYPQDIKILTPLRFVAALWVILYFFGDRLELGWREASGFIAKGYLGVDLFFILSGFILAHVYGPQVICKRFNYRSFLWARLARLYPVHLVTLFGLMILSLVARGAGIEVNEAFDTRTLGAQLLMVQAWGMTPAGSWNHPAWSISAEWFAYLLFPLSFTLVGFARRIPWVGVALAACLFGFMFVVVPQLAFFGGAALTELTANGGAVRIIPSFLMGAALWRLGQSAKLSKRAAWIGVWVSSASIVLIPSFGGNDALTWAGLAPLIFCLAETAKSGDSGAATGPLALWLGEASYALYMVHMPVDLVYFPVVEKLVQAPAGSPLALIIVLGAILASLIAAGILYQFLERPARTQLRLRDPFKKIDRL
jgi:peptidoglycan/LPS O-acetylase OafA/YrhL